MEKEEILNIIASAFTDNVTICYARFVKENFAVDMGVDFQAVSDKLTKMGYSPVSIRTLNTYLLKLPVKQAIAHFFSDVDVPENITRRDIEELGDLLKYNRN
jgi:hypothetical protein